MLSMTPVAERVQPGGPLPHAPSGSAETPNRAASGTVWRSIRALVLRQMRFSPRWHRILMWLCRRIGDNVQTGGGGGGGRHVLSRRQHNILAPNPHSFRLLPITGIQSITQEPGNQQISIKFKHSFDAGNSGIAERSAAIQQLLLVAARNNYNSGVRMDSVDVLTRQSPNELRIREVLVDRLQNDSKTTRRAPEGFWMLGRFGKR